jgi:hypothetical protein
MVPLLSLGFCYEDVVAGYIMKSGPMFLSKEEHWC